MFRNRLPRRVEVDWTRRRGERVPIIEGRTYVFGEPGFTERQGQAIEGMICWDPSQGWVLDVPREALIGAPPEEPQPD